MNIRILAALVAVFACCQAIAQTNLIPNPNFSDAKNPLLGWRMAFPYEPWYVANAGYVKPATEQGKSCALVELPPGIAGHQGGKIESACVKAEPGATDRVAVDCMTWDLSAKIHAEAWSSDPHPEQKRTIFRRAPADGRPALIMCYRAQVPSPPGNSKVWSSAGRDFTVPKTVVVAGKDQKPEFISVKVVNYGATMGAGKSYFANFRLFRLEPKPASAIPHAKP